MNTTPAKRLEKNIVKYAWYKVFTKRLYLPLITIQLVNVGKVSVEELAIIVIVSSIATALLQMPAGYFADKYGNRASIIIGAAISAPSPLLYVLMPNFWGGLVAAVLFFGGYAFQSGAIEAFMHNTLKALKREKEYSKVMGRAQTYGLLANVVLIAIVPATYAIDKNLPFLIGFLSLVAMLLLTISFAHPTRDQYKVTPKHPIAAVRSIVSMRNITLFVFVGFLTGVSNKGGEFLQLVFQDIGISVALFGVMLSASSIVGALMGWYIWVLDKLKPLYFYLFDVIVTALSLLAIGATQNPWVTTVAFVVFVGYGRVRMIVFQSKLLESSEHVYKATLLSALSLFTLIGDIAAISLITWFVGMRGYSGGYVVFGMAIFGIGLLLWFFVYSAYMRNQKLIQ